MWATRKIGYLLNQIRLQGPEQELIDQIVRLSIRYGIVTPYTSYLVTEDAPLGEVEQNRIAEEQFMALEAAPAAPTYGRDAVEKAAGQGEMADADTITAPLAEAANTVKVVGSRTFVLSDGVWIDTGFDPDTMQALKVAFLSDDYFDLVESRSELGAAFALGLRVIAISDGIAYEVVDPDLSMDPIEIPPQREEISPPDDVHEHPSEPDNPPQEPAIILETDSESPSSGIGLPCLGGLLPLMLFPLGLVALAIHVRRDTMIH